MAGVRDPDRFGQHVLGIEARQRLQGTQMPFGVGRQLGAEFADRLLEANGGKGVQQRLAFGPMHEHVVGGGDGQVEAHRQAQRLGHAVEIAAIEEQP